MMTGPEIARLRERNGWTQQQLADMLNASLERRYKPGRIGEWENGRTPVPKQVGSFLLALGLEEILPERGDGESGLLDGGPALGSSGPEGEEDTPPTGGGDPAPAPVAQQPLTGYSGAYARVCTELWELVATGVGMVGAVTGSEQLQADGRIIEADKEALGKAYGKLAETNETFRRMLTGMTTSGAWLEVSLATGITAGKIMRNHQRPKPKPVEEGRGDGAVVDFPHVAGA